MEQLPTAEQSLGQCIGRIAAVICHDGFPTGERAALRRMSPSEPPPLAFYRFALNYLPDGWEHRSADWVTLVSGIALMSPKAHQPDLGVGRALAEAKYSEARLERLLATDGDTRRTLLLRAARFLAAKNSSCNWLDFAQLLLTTNAEKRDKLHMRIAKDFYQNAKSR
jgi:CRISPR system Cascade subunit CasB